MFTITKLATIWSVEIDDVVGATTGLFKILADAGADITFALGRPLVDKPGQAILFVSPINSKEQEAAARKAGFVPRQDVVGVEVQGPNRTGGNFKLTAALAQANLNLRALVTSTIGEQFTAVFAFKTDADANEAIKVLHRVVEAK